MLLFALLVLAHLLGDFIFQTDRIAQGKGVVFKEVHNASTERSRRHFHVNKELVQHVSHHAVLTLLAVILFSFAEHRQTWGLLWIPLITAVTHFLIDVGKAVLSGTGVPNTSEIIPSRQHSQMRPPALLLFVFDQCCHLVVVIALVCLQSSGNPQALMAAFGTLMDGQPFTLSPGSKVIVIAIVAICTTVVSSTIVQMVATAPDLEKTQQPSGSQARYVDASEANGTGFFQYLVDELGGTERELASSFDNTVDERNTTIRRGRIIGYLERLILVTIIAMGAYAAITFIVAAKSLIRLKKFDDPAFAEYFLIGTLTSMFCGTLCGLLLTRLLG